MGNVISAGMGQAPARQIAIASGAHVHPAATRVLSASRFTRDRHPQHLPLHGGEQGVRLWHEEHHDGSAEHRHGPQRALRCATAQQAQLTLSAAIVMLGGHGGRWL